MSWSTKALEQFAAWGGLTPEQATDAGLFEVDSAQEIYPDFDSKPAIIIPYYSADGTLTTFARNGEELPFCRLRYLGVQAPLGFTKGKVKRYAQPGASGTRVYFPKTLNWASIVGDVQEPIVITEGEAKALIAAQYGITCLALGGVWNYAAKGQDDLLPELLAIKWRGRTVYIIFDSDAATNPSVIAAEARLVDELQRKAGAQCTIIRLPANGDQKEALDTFLEKVGLEGLQKLIERTAPCGALDAKVVALNKSCCWIEKEGMVYDREQRVFVKKDNFTNGSRFSSEHHITMAAKGRTDAKRVSVAATWLIHPHAARFPEILFRPGDGPVTKTDSGAPAMNMWEGWDSAPGDVEPFLELTEFLFSRMEPHDQDLPLKLLAYKAQNPAAKIPLAIMMLGRQGCGKGLWQECVMEAFHPYGEPLNSAIFGKEFNSWIERALVCVVQEAKPEHMQANSDRIKSLITDLKQPMRDLYRPMRKVNSYTFYIFSSNERGAGAFSTDDRRMIVVDCPPKEKLGDRATQEAFYYDRVGVWKTNGGGKKLLHYLLNMDLKGWRPPSAAPMTAEKNQAYVESLNPIQTLAEEMKEGSEHAVKRWMDQMMSWADNSINSNNPSLVAHARAIAANAPQMEIRPWYEPKEMIQLFPQLMEMLIGSRFDKSMSPGTISRLLREAGIPYLVNKDNPKGFMWKGMLRQYLVVYDFDEWEAPLTQIEFDRYMNNAPKYGDMRRARRAT